MKPALYTLFLLSLISAKVPAQDPTPLADKPGTWICAHLDDQNSKMYAAQFGMKPEEIAVFKQKLDKIVGVLHQHPILAQPKGFDPTVNSRIFYPHGYEKHAENYGYVGEINILFYTWLNIKGKVQKIKIEPPRESVYVNNCRPIINTAGSFEGDDKNGTLNDTANLLNLIVQPDRIRELAPGVILYPNFIVVAKPGSRITSP